MTKRRHQPKSRLQAPKPRPGSLHTQWRYQPSGGCVDGAPLPEPIDVDELNMAYGAVAYDAATADSDNGPSIGYMNLRTWIWFSIRFGGRKFPRKLSETQEEEV